MSLHLLLAILNRNLSKRPKREFCLVGVDFFEENVVRLSTTLETENALLKFQDGIRLEVVRRAVETRCLLESLD